MFGIPTPDSGWFGSNSCCGCCSLLTGMVDIDGMGLDTDENWDRNLDCCISALEGTGSGG